ncbi:MAG: dihydrofolate reductase family protein [Bacteroidota bacterium]
MANFVFIAESLDGYIAKKDGNIDWLLEIPNPGGSDYGYNDFIKNIDAVVLGRITFEKVLSFGGWHYSKPVFVLSNTLKSVGKNLENKAAVIKGDLKSVIKELHSKNYTNIYIDGGITIQNFLKEDLIDEMTITQIPIILGSGIPLFGELKNELRFEHVKTEVLNNALVQSRYKRIR